MALADEADLNKSHMDAPDFPTLNCSQHPSKILDTYCKDHDEVICTLCIDLNHSSCEIIHSITEEVCNLYNNKNCDEITQKINQTMKTFEEIKTEKERKLKKLKEAYDKEVESVKAFRQELQVLLDNIEQETLEEMKREFERIESGLTNDLLAANNQIDELNDISAQLTTSEGNKPQEFVSIKSAEKTTLKAETVAQEQQREIEETVSFTADQNITIFLQQIQTLGKVSSYKHLINNFKESLYERKQAREIYIKLDNDVSECNINHSCITDDGYLLLTDYTNQKLKRLDLSTETIQDYIAFDASPCAVCMISRTEAAVTLNNRTVQFVSLDTKMMATHTLTMTHYCYGIAHVDGKLFISDTENTVYIYDMNGQELQTITIDPSGNDIFQYNGHVTVSTDRGQVFVADYNKGVVILDIQGNYLSTLTDPILSGTWGVSTDGWNLFACGIFSNNIVQIGQDYNFLGEISAVDCPYSVCFDPYNTRLVVITAQTDTITVIELE